MDRSRCTRCCARTCTALTAFGRPRKRAVARRVRRARGMKDQQMSTLPRATGERTEDPLRGKTVRWTFEDGPTAGTTFEHRFSPDGTVEYRAVGPPSGTSTPCQRKPAAAPPLAQQPTRQFTLQPPPHVLSPSHLGPT